jgi:hypothetical protein
MATMRQRAATAIARTAHALGLALIQRSGRTKWAVLYDEVEREGEDDAECYYGFFSDPDQARAMFTDFASARPDRYGNVMLAHVASDQPPLDEQLKVGSFASPRPEIPAPSARVSSSPRLHVDFARFAEDVQYALDEHLKVRSFALRRISAPVERDRTFMAVDVGFHPPEITATSPPCQLMAPAEISNERRVERAMALLREARGLLRAAGARRAMEKVQLALKSADGARRHAGLEPIRLARQGKGGTS